MLHAFLHGKIDESLPERSKQPKRGRLWLTDGSCVRRRPAYRHHVWAYAFLTARTQDGRVLKILTNGGDASTTRCGHTVRWAIGPPAPEAIRPPSVSGLFMRPALS